MSEMCILFTKFIDDLSVMFFIANLVLIIKRIHDLLRFVHVDIHNHMFLLCDMILQFIIVMLIQSFVKVELIELFKGVITDSLEYLKKLLKIFWILVLEFPLHFFMIMQDAVVIG